MNSSSAVYSGFVNGDDFAASYSGVFADANVGSGKTVTITSSYAGADVSNYNITDQTSTTANISAKALTATARWIHHELNLFSHRSVVGKPSFGFEVRVIGIWKGKNDVEML